MRKIRKGKKMLLILLIVVVVALAAVFIIKGIINKGPGGGTVDERPQIIELPQTVYSNMEVKNIEMEYLKNQNKTMVTMEIHNTTETTVENEKLDAILIDANENVLGQMTTSIKKLAPGEQYDISVILAGDLTSAVQIKLIKK